MTDPLDDLYRKTEEHNEELLRNSAFTFSLEGISRDLKNLIQKKVSFTNSCMQHVTEMFNNLMSVRVASKKPVLNDEGEGILIDMLKHLRQEMEVTNMALNLCIQSAMRRENALNDHREDTESKTLKEREDD